MVETKSRRRATRPENSASFTRRDDWLDLVPPDELRERDVNEDLGVASAYEAFREAERVFARIGGGVKEEFEQHRYLRRIGKLHTPVIPIECPRARGIENQDFIREDKNPNRCWVDLASFRRNYPEIAEATDVAATVLANLREEPPLENWDGTTIGAVLRVSAIAMSGPLALFLTWLWRTRQVAPTR